VRKIKSHSQEKRRQQTKKLNFAERESGYS